MSATPAEAWREAATDLEEDARQLLDQARDLRVFAAGLTERARRYRDLAHAWDDAHRPRHEISVPEEPNLKP